MLLFFLFIQAVLTSQYGKELTLEETEKLTGSALEDYLKKHQTLFQVGRTPAAEEGMKHLMDLKYLEIPGDVEKVKIETDEEPPGQKTRLSKNFASFYTSLSVEPQSKIGIMVYEAYASLKAFDI
ncbi:unnamed protein product [Strongylus vulgaris]|uniref:Uncharacterized protein n=1 Tax=Strongylus vulgaris TaxID=40348 RepID=A0A3P7J0D1_STRVU|nr:unnamed protein product [Strongylus vulgaris]